MKRLLDIENDLADLKNVIRLGLQLPAKGADYVNCFESKTSYKLPEPV
jgi:hypothetical protein